MTQLIDKVAWIHVHDRKLLSTRSIGKDAYYIPGGKREGKETDTQTITREIKEELSVDLVEDSLEFFGTFTAQAHGKKEGVLVQIKCYTGNFTGELRPAAEIEEMVYLEYTDKLKSSPVDHFVFDLLKEQNLID